MERGARGIRMELGKTGPTVPVLVAGLSTLFGLVSAFSWLNRDFQLDDALIYHRYVRNLLEGDGLVYNTGERLNALTSPLFSYLSIVATSIVGNVQTASILLAGIMLLTGLLLWCALVTSGSGFAAGATGATLAASSPYFYKVYGMETPLFLLLIAACLYFFATNKDFWLGIAAALLLITRAEGVFLLLPLAVAYWREHKTLPSPKVWVAPLLILIAHYSLSFFYYGAFLPHTALVKIHQGQSGLWGAWPPFARAGYHLEWFFGGRGYLALTFLGLAIVGAVALRRTVLTRIGVPFLLLYTAFYVFLSLPSYHWYYAPYYMFGYFWAGAGLVELWRQGVRLRSTVSRTTCRSLLVLGSTILVVFQVAISWRTLRPQSEASAYQRIGEWIAANTPPQATIAAMEIGTIGWYSRRYIIDIVGLVTPTNDHLLAEGDFDSWLGHNDPDFVVTHLPEWRMESVMKEAVRRGRYRPVEGLELTGFQLLEKNSLIGSGTIDEFLARVRDQRDPAQRMQIIDVILSGGGGPLVELDGDRVAAANLSPDHWTRATEPAGIVVRNDGGEDRVISLHLTCLAPAADQPVTVHLEAAEGHRRVEFTEAGTQVVELWPVPPGEVRLFTVWTDKAWQPGSQDRRWLGVNIAVAD